MKKISISPSLLSADLLNLASTVKEIEDAGADALHIDVMDGHFVPNLSFGLPLIRALKQATRLPLDVHIMVSNPDSVAAAYIEAGADFLCFHIEASTHPYRTLQTIRKSGVKAGIALNPGTPMGHIKPLLDTLDMVLLLSVNPGFSGQNFIPVVYEKLIELRSWKADDRYAELIIAVDGGVSERNIHDLSLHGANFFVTGSHFFKSSDKKHIILSLREAAK